MLFALEQDEVQRLRQLDFRPEFTNAEMLMAIYRTDPEVIARVLPKPLKPAPEPYALAFVAKYPKTNFGVSYNEGALFVQAMYRGHVGGYCLSMPVDNDTALIGGREHYGFPKKMAEEISLETAGSTIVGRVVRRGTEILRIELEPSGPTEVGILSMLGNASVHERRASLPLSSYLFKSFPSPDGKGFDYLPRLVRQITVFRPRSGLRHGLSKVIVTSSEVDPLGEVPVLGSPVACVHGFWDNTMLPGRVVARVWNLWRFLPHAFFKDDAAIAALEAAEAERAPGPSPSITQGEHVV